MIGRECSIYDPVAGGAALVVIDVGSTVNALAVFKDPATGEPRLACGCKDGKCASSTRSRVARHCLCSRWARRVGAGGLHGPGDGRAAARERIRARKGARLRSGRGWRGAARDRGGNLARWRTSRTLRRARCSARAVEEVLVRKQQGACLRPGRGRRRAARLRCWFSNERHWRSSRNQRRARRELACGWYWGEIRRCTTSMRFLVTTRCSCSNAALFSEGFGREKTWRRARCGSRAGPLTRRCVRPGRRRRGAGRARGAHRRCEALTAFTTRRRASRGS